ncbi:response regulator transcription factor [Acholeplasma vituli]|uniref:Response regulator transcription factor n=1 Tax=Paracholeplasma vituli TaxID=69473 RepID=A0ABT2PZY1_9MOLU|nr:response regulator transcription factor [Paracholeplasma vituli]MCU0105218.1 response regulator transcription factor [Paracholeplasma vituli]
MKTLIVEDYPKINQLLAMYARNDGHEVKQVYNGEEALAAVHHEKFDIILLDLMLPGIQGEELIKQIRKVSDVYIIVLSAKIDIKDRVDVITLGADDYMIKPFSIDEVMAKLKNVEKRLVVNHPTIYTFNHSHLKVLPLSREVLVNNQLINLTQYEYDVLWHLLSHPNIVFSRDMIIEQCFSNSDAYDRVIDVFIKNIRKKIDFSSEKSYIKTHYGIGYQFVGVKDE